MNLHIVSDEKFINGAIKLFEKYAPKENIFIVNSDQKKLEYVNLVKNVLVMRLSDISSIKSIKKIVEGKKINNLYIHYLGTLKAAIANYLKNKYHLKTFWIFYGDDLYRLLNRDFGYQLQDNPIKKQVALSDKMRTKASDFKFLYVYKTTPQKATLAFIKNLDYFCFWNTFDFQLLKKYYQTDAELIPFAYFDAIDGSPKKLEEKNKLKILINNSASSNGNHDTLLHKIHQIDHEKTIEEIIVPLSYGNKEIRNITLKIGKKLFDSRFNPLLTFMERDAYFNLFNEVSVAFFGSRRQEAAANVFQLLAMGVKVFLRNENNMMNYLKEKGFLVYSFEDDFNSMKALTPLSKEQIMMNLQASANLFRQYNEKAIMQKILNP